MATVKLDPAKGIQIPNLTTTERNAISSPETGAIIWNTTTSEINQYNGSAWEITYTDTNTQIAGITSSADATAITINSNEQVGVGTTTPARLFAVSTGGAKTDTNIKYVQNLVQSNESSNQAALGLYFKGASSAADRIFQLQPVELGVANDGLIEVNPDGGKFRANRGILFGTDTAAANALDDYEEGNWTPTLTNSGTISHRVGKYVKIGNQIMVQGEIRTTSYTNSGSTDVKIGGLPYSSFNESNYNFAANITPVNGFNSNATQGIAGYVGPNQTDINLYGVNFSAGVNYDFLQTGEMGTTVEVFFAVHYRTN